MSDTNLLDALAQNYFRKYIKKLILSRLLLPAYKLLYIGSKNRDYYIWLLGRKRLSDKLYNFPYPAIPIHLEKEQVKIETPNRYLRILYVGRLEPIKGINNLIKSISLLSTTVKCSVRIDLYGSGSEHKKLIALAGKLGLNEIIHFHGAVKSNVVDEAYKNSDIFILPSEREPWGIVVNEAMSAGIPVMCPFWVGAAADLVIDGVTGFLIDDNSPEEIASGIERVLEQREILPIIGKHARKIVLEGPWNLEAVTKSFVTLVDGQY